MKQGKFKDIAKVKMGQSPISKSYNREGNGVALINGPTEFTSRYPIKKQWTSKPTKLCNKGDILFCVRGSSTGRINIANDEYCIGRGVAAISAISNKSEIAYLEQYLSFVISNILKYTVGSTFPNIDKKTLEKLPIIYHSIPEQKKIAEILSTWDKAIEVTQKMIDTKTKLKKGLMQQLLAGKKRFKEFGKPVKNNGELPRGWEEKKLGEITKKLSRRNKNLVKANVYSVTNINGFVLQTEHFSKEIAGDDLTNYKTIKQNEFAYNPARVNVGSIALFKNKIGIISSLYVCFSTTDKLLSTYLEFLLETDKMKYDINRFGEGGVRIYLWYYLFKNIKIKLPSLVEQTHIVTFLSTVEKEIDLLNKKLKSLKFQKKGLMQKLLTGKIRVKV